MPNTPLCRALLNQSSCVSLKSFFRLTILVSFLISYFMQDSKTASEVWLGTLGFPCCCVVCCAVVGVVYVVGAFGSMMKQTVLGSCSRPSSSCCCCGLAAKYDKMLREFGTLTRKGRAREKDAVSGGRGNSKIAPFCALPWKLSENAIVEFSPARSAEFA